MSGGEAKDAMSCQLTSGTEANGDDVDRAVV